MFRWAPKPRGVGNERVMQIQPTNSAQKSFRKGKVYKKDCKIKQKEKKITKCGPCGGMFRWATNPRGVGNERVMQIQPTNSAQKSFRKVKVYKKDYKSKTKRKENYKMGAMWGHVSLGAETARCRK